MSTTTEYSKVDLRVGTDAQFQANLASLPVGAIWGSTDSKVAEDDLSDELKTKINRGAPPSLEIKRVTKTYSFTSVNNGTMDAIDTFIYVNDNLFSHRCHFEKSYYESYECDGTLSPMLTNSAWTDGENTLSNITNSDHLMYPISGTEINSSTQKFESFPEQLFSDYTTDDGSINFVYQEETYYFYQWTEG